MDISEVVFSKQAEKHLRKVPTYVVLKLQAWIDCIIMEGLMEVRKIPGFHDEPLKGKRSGQRSIRLSKGYRAFYTMDARGKTFIIEITEVNKHEY